MANNIQYKLENNGTEFCAYSDNQEIGDITFVKTGDSTLIIDHTGVDARYKGQSIGTELVRQVVKLARKENKKIIPLCPFARAVFQKHPEFNDVLTRA
ncbi:MAG: N-acetyltransferase [Rickettsiales bacterium]|jgi:predicted GNAT family acetyltransferase|nr:N-acetyltransferase [Rickettsiales bacterium]